MLRPSFRRSLLLISTLLFPTFCIAFEPYDLIEGLLPKDKFPRVLNSTDIELNPNDPEPLFTPDGDFNNDGVLDMAISGISGLPGTKPTYFLLVGTQLQNPVRYQKLFFQEYAAPVFLHKPGTTGEKDPGDQAFSITPCSHCSDGTDFYWDPNKQTFKQTAWVKRVRHFQNVQRRPDEEPVPPELVDKALKIAGELTDVKVFVAGIKKAGKQLGTRVRAVDLEKQQVAVSIFEKKKQKEILYDEITVDAENGTVVKRGRSR